MATLLHVIFFSQASFQFSELILKKYSKHTWISLSQTDNLELKKLVYLYLMNYAKSQPEMAIMAVNTFVKDCEDPNPLIRALAVRTMGCIRVDKITGERRG